MASDDYKRLGMFTERRNIERSEADVPIKVLLQNNLDNEMVIGPTEGRLHNISDHGAGISVSKISFSKHHLVYGAQDKEEPRTLLIDIGPSGSLKNNLRLPVKPVWFDNYLHEDGSVRFRIGLEFMTPPNAETISFFNKAGFGSPGRHWWSQLISRIQEVLRLHVNSDPKNMETQAQGSRP